jgi:glycosyltransferase involved in cell wall biosynthesis
VVYELKPRVDGSPGFLVFTHKERPLLFDPPAALAARLRALKREFVVGMQWGRYHDDVGETPYVDLHLACPGTVRFRDDADVRRVPLCSRNFTPARFRPMDVPVTWDVVSVGHPIDDKRYGEFLDVLRRVFDAGVEPRVLLLCAVPDDPAKLGPRWDHDFFEKYETLFSDAERARIDLGVPGEVQFGSRPIHPVPNAVLPYLYNASHSFTLFSQEEGQSKVIHEALLCGTPVVVREDLRGGGLDYLDERNSLQFGTLDEARDAFVEVVERPGEYAFDPSYLRPELSEAETADRLEAAVEATYDALDRPYRGEIEKTDVAFKLGGHTVTLPERLRGSTTNDLRDRTALLRYAAMRLDDDPSRAELLATRRADLAARFDPVSLAGDALSRVETATGLPVHRTAARLYPGDR